MQAFLPGNTACSVVVVEHGDACVRAQMYMLLHTTTHTHSKHQNARRATFLTCASRAQVLGEMQAQIKRLRKLRLRRERLRRERSVWICVSFPVSYACLFTGARRRWRVRSRTVWSPLVHGPGALHSRPFASPAAEIGTARTIRMCGGCLKMTRTTRISFRTIGSGSFEGVGDERAVRGGSCRSGLFMGWCEGAGGYVMFMYTQRPEHPPPKTSAGGHIHAR
jgi:hypothetical protein